MRGIIVKGIGGFYYVKSEDGIYSCRARGKFRKESLSPIVGDIITLELASDGTGSIVKIHPRKKLSDSSGMWT